MDASAPAVGEKSPSNFDVRAYVAVLFSDICGSTTIAAQVDADSYGEMLESVRRDAAPIISAFDGTIAQVYGDGILSVFRGAGAAARAVEAAIRLHAAANAIPPPAGTSVSRLQLHSGVHYGLALIRPGDRVRGSVEIVGRTTAVAQRLSAAAGAGEILVSQGSIGPGRDSMVSGSLRLIDIGDGTAPMPALPLLSGDGQVRPRRAVPLVGRDSLLAQFTRLVGGLHEGAFPRLMVIGSPGMGKSRLSHEIAQLGSRQGVATWSGSCSASTDSGPLQAFRQILEQQQPGAATDVGLAAQLLAAVGAAIVERPLLLMLDDWQWADSASRALLVELSALPGALGILLFSRERDIADIPVEGFATLQVPPLTPAETAQLVRFLRPEFDPLDASRVHVRAGGNPLFVEELCLLDAYTARTLLPGTAEPGGVGWLASLASARMQHLPPEARSVLEIAAVIGMRPQRWLLEEIAGERVETAISLLVQRDFLIRQEPDELQFRHGVNWEIVYSLIPLAERRRLHAEIARLMLAHGELEEPGFHAALAWHFFCSDQPWKCLPHAETAGDRALAMGSLDAARTQYRLALDAAAQVSSAAIDPQWLRTIVGKFGYVCIYDADSGQIPVFEKVAAWAVQRGDRQAEAEVEYWLGFIAHGAGDSRRAIRHCRHALELWEGDGASPFAVQVRATLGQSLVMTANYADAAPLLAEALDVKRKHRSGRHVSPGTAYAMALQAALLADMGRFAEGCAMIAEAEELTRGEIHPVAGSVLSWSSAIHAWRGDWRRLVETAERGSAVARRVEAVYIHAICRAFESYGRWRLDGSEAAAAELQAAVACMVGRGKALALSIPLGFLAEVHAAKGDVAGCRQAVTGAVHRARIGEPVGLASAARSWAETLAPRNPERARVWLERARASGRARSSPHELARCDLAEVRMGLAPEGQRGAILARAAAAFSQMGMANLQYEAEAAISAG